MTPNLFLERTFDEPLTPAEVQDGAREIGWCLDLHRVRWHGSFLAHDGRTMICAFSGTDLESGRLALRDPDIDLSRFWSGTVHSGSALRAPNVVVERSFATPTRVEDLLAAGNEKAWCYETHDVTYLHSFCSRDRKRMLCFYAAPDAEAVRIVQRETGLPMDSIWSGAEIPPIAR
jgi:hypothetical protein